MGEQITNLGQAVNILIQVATLAQSKGILTLAEAVVVKESIDFINKLQEQQAPQGEQSSAPTPEEVKPKAKAKKAE